MTSLSTRPKTLTNKQIIRYGHYFDIRTCKVINIVDNHDAGPVAVKQINTNTKKHNQPVDLVKRLLGVGMNNGQDLYMIIDIIDVITCFIIR